MVDGAAWPGVGHLNKNGGGARNQFGLAFAAEGNEWTQKLCNADTDGDGITNGDHLGDPLCVWQPGDTPSRTAAITHPGNTAAASSAGSAAPAWVIAHGVLMLLAWCLVLPIGIMCSVFRAGFPEEGAWFKQHQNFQWTGLMLVIAAFVVAVVMLPAGSGHFSGGNVAHKVIGLVVVVLAVLQPFNAACRPHPPGAGEEKSGKRLVWELTHKNSGRIAASLAITNCILGALAVSGGYGSSAAIFAWVVLGVSLVITVAVVVVLMSKAKRAKE